MLITHKKTFTNLFYQECFEKLLDTELMHNFVTKEGTLDYMVSKGK